MFQGQVLARSLSSHMDDMAAGHFRQRTLQLDGVDVNLPLSIPLAYPDDCIYHPKDFRIEKKPSPDGSSSLGPKNLLLVSDAIRLIQSVGEKPIAVVSICGPCRSGKSYFLSRTIGCKNVFEMSSTVESCTRGIWLSTIALECDDFLVLFLDTEGADAVGPGETSENFSLKVFSFTALLSSFLIYNSRVPKKSDISRIKNFVEFSELISSSCNDPQNTLKCMPKLLWLLRDVTLPFTEKDSDVVISPTEYMTKYVLGLTSHPTNSIGSMFVKSFSGFKCLKLCRPKKPKELEHLFDNLGLDNQKFTDDINYAIDHIRAHLSVKTCYGSNKSITGSSLSILAEKYITALNDNSIPDLEKSWIAVIEMKLENHCEHLVDSYRDKMSEKLQGKFPMEQTRLLKVHNEVQALVLRDLAEIIHNHLPHLVVRDTEQYHKYGKKLTSRFKDDELPQFSLKNKYESGEYCKQLLLELERANLNLAEIITCYHERAVGPAKEEVYLKEVATIPGNPEQVHIHEITHTTVEVAWKPPLINSTDIEYKIQTSSKDDDKWSYPPQITRHLKVEFNNLKPITAYKLRICSRNVVSQKDSIFKEVHFSTLVGPPKKPGRISFRTVSWDQGILTCMPPKQEDGNGAQITHLVAKLRYRNHLWCMCKQESFPIHFEDAEDYCSYHLKLPNITVRRKTFLTVFWENAVGLGEPSNQISIESTDFIPGPPLNFRRKGRTSSSIKIRFDIPRINPAAVHCYKVFLRKYRAEEETQLQETFKCSAVASELDSNTSYAFRVLAINRNNEHMQLCEKSSETVWFKTKRNKIVTGMITAGVAAGCTAAGPAIGAGSIPFLSGDLLSEGIKEKKPLKIAGGIAGLASTPLSVPFGAVVGTLAAPWYGFGFGYLVHSELQDSNDEDSDNESKECTGGALELQHSNNEDSDNESKECTGGALELQDSNDEDSDNESKECTGGALELQDSNDEDSDNESKECTGGALELQDSNDEDSDNESKECTGGANFTGDRFTSSADSETESLADRSRSSSLENESSHNTPSIGNKSSSSNTESITEKNQSNIPPLLATNMFWDIENDYAIDTRTCESVL